MVYFKGFVCVCGFGIVYFYEKIDDKEYFKKIREIKVNIMFVIIKFLG